MAVTFELPPELESELRHNGNDLDAEAKEALLVALYRSGRLSHAALARGLGLDRLAAETVLRKHNVTEDLGTLDEYVRDAEMLAELRESIQSK